MFSITINGKRLTVITEQDRHTTHKYNGKAYPMSALKEVGPGLYISAPLSLRELMDLTGPHPTFDAALPDSFYYQYKEKHGKRPQAVWMYREGEAPGPFFLEEAWDILRQRVKEELESGDNLTVYDLDGKVQKYED